MIGLQKMATALSAVLVAGCLAVVTGTVSAPPAAAAVSSQPPPGGQYYPDPSASPSTANSFIVGCGGGTIDLASLVPGITGVTSVTENLTTTIVPTPGGTAGELDVSWSGLCLFDEATVAAATAGGPVTVTIYIARATWATIVDTPSGYPVNSMSYPPPPCRPGTGTAAFNTQFLWSTGTGEVATPEFSSSFDGTSTNTNYALTRSGDPDGISYPAQSWAAALIPASDPPGPQPPRPECIAFFQLGPADITLAAGSQVTADGNAVPAGDTTTVDHFLNNIYQEVPDAGVATDWCGNPAYVSGDLDSDGLLNYDTTTGAPEVWAFGSCETEPLYQDSIFQYYWNGEPPAGTGGGAGVPVGAPGVYTAWGVDGTGEDRYSMQLSASAPALVDVTNQLELTKTADTEVCCDSGTPVNYTFEVTATGADWTSEVSVTDDQCSPTPVLDTGFNVGDLNQDGYLQGLVPGVQEPETWQFSCQQVISETTTNTATASAVTEDAWPNPQGVSGGSPFLPPGELPSGLSSALPWADLPDTGYLEAVTVDADPRTWTVELAPEASIDIQKRIESSPGSGTFIEADDSDGEIGLVYADVPARFEISVTNTGDQDLADVVVADPAGDCARTIGTLAVDETVTYACTALVAGDASESAAEVSGILTIGDCDDPPADIDVARYETDEVPPIEPPPIPGRPLLPVVG